MPWISTTDDGNWYIGPARLPNRLAESLFPPKMMQPDSRVLLLGSAAQFEPWLNWLGIPCATIRTVTPETLQVVEDQTFDVVLARDLPEYLGSLCSESPYRMTAELVCKVRPGGRLILLARCEPTGIGHATGHLRGCYARHMGAFDGLCQVKLFGDPWTNWKFWNWLVGLQPRSGYLTTILEIPFQSLPREYWNAQALKATHRESQPCCLWSRQQLLENHAATSKAA